MLKIYFGMFDKTGLGPVIREFNRAGLKVDDVEATNKGKRESGFLIKTARITFESGQKLLVKAKAGGSIFQVKLNNKVVPIRNVDDMDKAVAEVIALVKANEERYKKLKARRLVKPLRLSPTPVNKSTAIHNAEKIEALKAHNAETIAALEFLKRETVELQREKAVKLARIEQLKAQLGYENMRGRRLQRELAALKGE